MTTHRFPIGQKLSLPGHFPEPVMLEGVRPIGDGFECRVRLPDGTPDETTLSQKAMGVACKSFGVNVNQLLKKGRA